jgi:hypothetical protein
VRDAYDVFIRDSINVGDLGTSGGVLSQANSIIKASPIMAGARTLQGCLVPLVGTAPTRFGTEGGWNYNRKTGLQGNGTDNYLNSNRRNDADPQNSSHNACYISAAPSAARGIMGSGGTAAGSNNIFADVGGANGLFVRNRSATFFVAGSATATGLAGHSRNSSASYQAHASGLTQSVIRSSDGMTSDDITIFTRGILYSNARLAFYSIGESLDLALLDARVTALIDALAAAIP